MEQKELPEILTLKQASEVLHCHPNTLRTWEREGLIKCIRFGKRGDRRFSKEEIIRKKKKKINLSK